MIRWFTRSLLFLSVQHTKLFVSCPLALIIITVLFNAYIQQQHFRVAEYLPTKECLKVDIRNGDDFAVELVKDAYLQKELSEKELFPENIDDLRLAALGLKNEEEAKSLQSSQYSRKDESPDDRSLLGKIFYRWWALYSFKILKARGSLGSCSRGLCFQFFL